MLDQLQTLSESLNALHEQEGKPAVRFGYGTRAELNVLADSLAGGYLIFHEGYFDSVPRITQANTFESVHNLTLWVFMRSALSDKPEQKRANLDALKPLYRQVVNRLDALGKMANTRAVFAQLNMTDCNLDGLRITTTLTPPTEAIC